MRLDVSVPASTCANLGRFVAKKNPIAGRTIMSLQDRRPECAGLRGDAGQQAGRFQRHGIPHAGHHEGAQGFLKSRSPWES